MMNLYTLLITFSGVIGLVLASPVAIGDGDGDAGGHALDDWINRSTGAVSDPDNPNKRPGAACTVIDDKGAEIPGKASYPSDCTTLSVWKNSFEEDRNARIGDPASCMLFFSSVFLVEGYALYPFASFLIHKIVRFRCNHSPETTPMLREHSLLYKIEAKRLLHQCPDEDLCHWRCICVSSFFLLKCWCPRS